MYSSHLITLNLWYNFSSMFKWINLTALFILLLFKNSVVAQDILKTAEDKDSKRDTKVYSIISIDGKNEDIHIMPDYAKDKLRISCNTDTLKINDFWGVPVEAHVLNKSFIQVIIKIRAGSNEGLENMMIFCVDKNRFCEAMSINSASNFDYGNYYGRGAYNVKVFLKGSSKKDYRLEAHINDHAHSKLEHSYNYNYNNLTTLNFDPDLDVFYSVKDFLPGSFTIYDAKTNKPYKQKINNFYPMMILGKMNYYFFKGEWYEVGKANELSKDSFITHK